LPFPNYHAARIKSPTLFVRILTIQTLPNGIRILGGTLKSDPRGGVKTQSYRFPKNKFTAAEARKWLKEHKLNYISFEPARS